MPGTARVTRVVRAIREGDEATVEDGLERLSRSRPAFAPLALALGAVVLLFHGLRLVVSNWRLTLVQVLPAMWIWLLMLDLRVHAVRGQSFHVLRGPILLPVIAVITAITVATFFLNAVFAFAVARSATPEIRPAFAEARAHVAVIVAWGALVGLVLAVSTTLVPRYPPPWFAVCLSIAIAVLTVCYVAVPSRLIGSTPVASRRDKLVAAALSGAAGAVVCAPPYVVTRLGVLMLGSPVLLVPGLIVVTVGATLHAGATGAVKAVKLSAKLVGGGAR